MKKVISIISLLFLISCLFCPCIAKGDLIDDLRTEMAKKEQEIKELEARAAQYKSQLKDAQNEGKSLLNEINIIQTRISKLQNDILITSTRISNTSLRIEELSLKIGDKQNEIDKKKDSIAETIRTLNQSDQESLMEVILIEENFSDFINQVHYLELLQENIQRDLSILQQLKQEMEEEKQDAEIKKRELTSLNNQLYSQKGIVDSEKKEKNYLLVQTKGEEKEYQILLDDVLKKQQEIQQEIYDIEDKIKLTIDPNSLPEARSGVFIWPLDGILTQGYGITPYSKRLYASGFHNGIDIASSYGEPIRAAKDGEVLAIGSCGRYAYGNWIAIKHENKLTTFYAHLSGYASLRVGQKVSTGQIIGYEGSTGYSTGPHLHFGVYVTETFRVEARWYGQLPLGAHLDPMKYL